jgi:hypothetical protein
MMYAFSRDGAIPGSKFLHKVDQWWRFPIRTGSTFSFWLLYGDLSQETDDPCSLSVWLACALSFILGLPSLGSSVAFSTTTSITMIGLYTSYGMAFKPS